MNSITKIFKSKKLNSWTAALAFFLALWRLRSLLAALMAVFISLCLAMYGFGAPVDTSTHTPCAFWDTVYFCCITALTIGYGDIVATSGIGHCLAVALGLLGVLFTGLMTAVAVHAVSQAANRLE